MEWEQSIDRVLSGAFRPSLQRLQAVIQSLELSLDKVAAHIADPGSLPYGRTSLYRSKEAEAVLIHLPCGRETYIHDHGYSIGCAKVLEGTIANRIYRLDEYGYPVLCAETILEQGRCFNAPRGQIHQLCNAGPGRAVSFHLYAPALSGVRNYYLYEHALDFVI